MLINTVILFLRDALPIFVLLVYLSTHLKASPLWASLSLLSGAILSFIYVSQIQVIARLFQGNGVELFVWLSQLSIYVLTLYLGYALLKQKSFPLRILFGIASIMLSLTFVCKGGNFILYFEGYWQQNYMLQPMLLGTLLGIGICISFSILLYLTTLWLRQKFGPWITWFLLLVHTTGQLTNALPLLIQTDIIEASAITWNSKHIVSNQSELGYLMNVLIGYQATPSVTQLVMTITALLLPLSFFYWMNLKQVNHSGNTL